MRNLRSLKQKLSTVLVNSFVVGLNLLVLNSCAASAQTGINYDVPSAESTLEKPQATVEDSTKTYTKPTEWKYINEQEWLVDQIGCDIAEMLGYAKYGRTAGGFSRNDLKLTTKTENATTGLYSYSAKIAKDNSNFACKLRLIDYVWSPLSYEPFAEQILQTLNLQSSPSSEHPEQFLENISKADFKYLFLENERISKSINQNPLDASLHEQAALLLGIFTSLEVSGSFIDNRPTLNRMCAHLTLAKALNKKQFSNVGQMANAILESLSCRKSIAYKIVKKLESETTNKQEKSILRAIEMRINHDPRSYRNAESTPLEDITFAQFFIQSRTIDEAMKRFVKDNVPLTQQWRRLLAAGEKRVASGSLLQAKMISSEIADFLSCRNEYKNVLDSNFASCCDELNELPAGCLSNQKESAKLNVLSWENVCSTFNRQLANAIFKEYGYYRWMYSDLDMAKRVKDDVYKQFATIAYFPFAAERLSMTADEKENVYDAIKKFLVLRPEAVSSQIWKLSVEMAAKGGNMLAPPPEAWFEPAMPIGTVFTERTAHKNCQKTLAYIEELRRLSPFDPYLSVAWLREKYGEFPTAEQYRQAFGSLADYDVQAMRCVCRGEIHNPERFLTIGEKIAKADPLIYFDMADYCVINHLPKKAAEFYEKAFKNSTSQILTSNRSDWMVQHLYNSGEKAAAERLAKSAAAVYSRAGLQTLARFYERENRLNDAEKQYQMILERYKNSAPLLSFYLRFKDKEPKFAQNAAGLITKKFPTGLEKISLTNLSKEPDKGLIVQGTWWISDSPLKLNTVIVGINGYAVTSVDQYDVLKELSEQNLCSVIYWDGKQYKVRNEPTIYLNAPNLSVMQYRKTH